MSLRTLVDLILETKSQNQTHTTTQETSTDMEAGDHAYKWLKTNHPTIHDYIKNDAHVPVDPVQTIKAIKSMGASNALAMIKNHLRTDTKNVWEPISGTNWPDHIPQHLATEELIFEGLDIDVTWKKHGDNITQRMFDHDVLDNHKHTFHQKLADADPTPHKEYAPWIADRYAKGGEVRNSETNELLGYKGINHLEDFGRVHQALSEFNDAKIKKKLTKNGINADINSYKSLTDLEDAVDKIPKEATKKEELKAVKETEATKYDTEHWTTIIPHTHAAAIAYGAGTKWCTTMAASHYFTSYNNQGPMHIIVPKKPKYPGEKYQFHMHSNQFMDPKDAPADALEVFKDRPNPVLHEYANQHQSELDNSDRSRDKMRLIQVAHDPKQYLNKYLTNGGPDIQSAVARLGTPEQKEALINNPNISETMKINFIKGGNPAHIAKFAGDRSSRVQAAVAEYGTDEHRDALIKNTNLDPTVKVGLINSGKPKYIEPFLNDKSHEVHKAIFTHGSEDHKDFILYKNPHIALDTIKSAIESKNPKHLDNFMTHSDNVVRALVAKHGTDKHRSVLKNDPSFLVSSTANETSTL